MAAGPLPASASVLLHCRAWLCVPVQRQRRARLRGDAGWVIVAQRRTPRVLSVSPGRGCAERAEDANQWILDVNAMSETNAAHIHPSRISRSARRWVALALWGAGLALFAVLGFWNTESSRRDAENRLIAEAGRAAAQLAALLALPAWELDELTARTIVMGAMEDERIYAVKVETRQGMLEGQRRNYYWEPVPWDDEIAENCVQGMNPLKMEGQNVGTVEVWLSPRLNGEEEGQLARRERWRFGLAALLWTGTFLFLFWQWGDLAALRRRLGRIEDADAATPERVVLGLSPAEPDHPDHQPAGPDQPERADQGAEGGQAQQTAPACDAGQGRRYQRRHPEAWYVTAGLFRQTFGRAPRLMSRLFAEGDGAALCHLARMLERAAPCLGATRLETAAAALRAAFSDPECQTRALSVEECTAALEEVLEALAAGTVPPGDGAQGTSGAARSR